MRSDLTTACVHVWICLFASFFVCNHWCICVELLVKKDWCLNAFCANQSEKENTENLHGETFLPVSLNASSCCVVEFIRIWHSSEQPKCIRRNNLTIVRRWHKTFWVVFLGVVLTFPWKTEVFFEEFEFKVRNDSDSGGITIILCLEFSLHFILK